MRERSGPLPAECILAIDLGTSSVKLALVSVHGEILDGEVEPLEVSLLEGGGAEQSPDHWWAALTSGVHRLLARGRVPGELISSRPSA